MEETRDELQREIEGLMEAQQRLQKISLRHYDAYLKMQRRVKMLDIQIDELITKLAINNLFDGGLQKSD